MQTPAFDPRAVLSEHDTHETTRRHKVVGIFIQSAPTAVAPATGAYNLKAAPPDVCAFFVPASDFFQPAMEPSASSCRARKRVELLA